MNEGLLYGPVMIDLKGPSLSESEKDKINHPNTGAVILFSRNFENPEQVATLIDDIRSARNGSILIAVDQEGGRVQRFQKGFTRLPCAAHFVQQGDQASTLATSTGWLMATELLALDIDFSFAPVLDVDCGISSIIGDRAFSQDPEVAAAIARAFRNGMRQAGMAATGKHFPGHGAVAADSHLDLPVDERDLDSIRKKDLIPFKQLIDDGLEAIMPAHIVYPQVDKQPAGFSKIWIEQILRSELNFNGIVFSDDLSMAGAAIAGSFIDRAQLALQAGCDMVLVCNNPEAADQVLEALPVQANTLRQQRLTAMTGKPVMSWSQMQKSERWQDISKYMKQLAQQT